MDGDNYTMATESAVRTNHTDSTLCLRMTPEIMAELAFQQVNLIASRLTLTGQRDFYAKLQKYISEIQ